MDRLTGTMHISCRRGVVGGAFPLRSIILILIHRAEEEGIQCDLSQVHLRHDQ